MTDSTKANSSRSSVIIQMIDRSAGILSNMSDRAILFDELWVKFICKRRRQIAFKFGGN